ncbi:MAG: hypothetical protein ABII07_04640 [Patescibacteria group bacterium]|nr:hypothetical protein [Patescibacteria group bacterium]
MDSINLQNEQPQESISEIDAALTQVKAWKEAGNTEDAVEGLKEILTMEPENSEAKQLLNELQTPKVTTIETEHPQIPEKKPSHGILLNLIILVITVGILGGATYTYISFKSEPEDTYEIKPPPIAIEDLPTEEENSPEEIETPEFPEEENTSASRNDQRFLDLTLIEQELESYYEEHRVYPSAKNLSELLGKLPYDPLDEEEFMYSYAVYDNYLGSNQEYILAGVFEEENGENTLWTTGASPADHPNYRDSSLENITLISEVVVIEEEEETPNIKVKR